MSDFRDFHEPSKSTKSKPGFVRKNCWFRIETWDAFKNECLNEGLSPSELLEEIVEDYLADRSDQPRKN